ncbi:hypothetical protein KUH32_06120 [Thalassococcus sp. CAU 1522]|uniref:Flagellar FliJ protein n=1 Tax=Thalassococcus arenae TaxID=2851652 RepID=A0ABS6N749_9RHOB|nr:hypothetical protein [Thalassococcus arenae]MBV2359340.1 hypothetical protein [Thalassococcus arenae]
MSHENETLTHLSNLLLDQALARHRRNLAQERQSRIEVEGIDALRREALSREGDFGLRERLGADLLWHGWLLTRRATLLREQAQYRVRQEQSLIEARLAFGKAQATQDIEDDTRRRQKQDRSARLDQALSDLTVLSAWNAAFD